MNSNKHEPLLIEPSPDASSSEASLGLEKAKNKTLTTDKLNKPPRKRSRIACTWCRDRKVRCDASSHGTPCTNCELDQQECVVHSASQSKNIRGKKRASRHQPYPSPTTPGTGKPSVFQPSETSSRSPLISHPWNEGAVDKTPWRTPPHLSSSSSASSSTTHLSTISDVLYSFHPFLTLPGLSDIPQEDIQYLTIKGCFRVPSGAILDEFIRRYFLYVHPCLPIINEVEFWQTYYRQSSPDDNDGNSSVSLFTFQAMLFASSAFVSEKTIQSAGFPDTRTARNALYTRAKLLYDLGCEKSPLSTAQGSLLLTHQSSPSDLHAGSLWLSIAIQNAIVYNALHPASTDTTRKRIWWCILLRDRIMALGLRRHPRITPQTLDLDPGLTGVGVVCGGVLADKDLESEISGSEVYDPETKRLLAKVVGVQCELAVCLGDVLGVVHSSASPTNIGDGKIVGDINATRTQRQTQKEVPCVKEQVAKCKASLLRWSTNAKAALGAVVNSHMTHESVGLFFGLTFFYYHAARLALCNFEALGIQLNKHSNTGNTKKPNQDTEDADADQERIQDELEDATGCITDTIKRFLAQGVAHNLPISAAPLIAHPLLLSALDVKLSSTKSQSATRKRRFRYYANLMQVFQQRYDGTDTVAAFIQQTLQLAGYLLPRLQEQARGRSSNSGHFEPDSAGSSGKCSSWSELFAESPNLYLRLLFALDYAISRGYFPSYGEVQRRLGGEDIDFHQVEDDTGEPENVLMPDCSSGGVSGLGIKPSLSSPYMDLASGSGLAGRMAMNLANVYTLLDSEQQHQHQHQHQQQPLKTSSAEPYAVPDYERQVFDPLVLPTYNPMLDSEYAYPGHVPFTHQNYEYGMYQPRENGGPDILHLGSSSESYSDVVALPVGAGEEECVNG